MMSTWKAGLILFVLTLLVALAIPAPGVRGGGGIVVNNADTVREEGVARSAGLEASMANVGPRLVVQYANSLRSFLLPPLPPSLNSRLGEVQARLVFQYANSNRLYSLPAVPAALNSLLGQVAERIVFQYANSNRAYELSYPLALVDDNVPPQGSDFEEAVVTESSAMISWTTDEFANSEVRFGTQSGNYTRTVSDPLYVKQHRVTLTGLARGSTYYYRVRSTDQSGNVYQSGEYTFRLTLETNLFLPTVRRR